MWGGLRPVCAPELARVSAIGPSGTSEWHLRMSAFGGKADISANAARPYELAFECISNGRGSLASFRIHPRTNWLANFAAISGLAKHHLM
jgi:hypothetical protein